MKTPPSQNDPLISLPYTKIYQSLQDTIKNCNTCGKKSDVTLECACPNCIAINEIKQRYAKSNIPLKYWDLWMNKHFKGDPDLLDRYNHIINNIHTVYKEGNSICFAGMYGIGKTFCITNILKHACGKGYTCLYMTLTDIVELITAHNIDKIYIKKQLITTDFLAIEEFDPRYMGSANASDLFGRTLENILRTRMQNTLPLFLSTNSPNVIDSFSGSIKDSIDSLMSYVEIVPITGEDFRKSHKE